MVNLDPPVADPWCTATRHGTRPAYGGGCRCTTARTAAARYEAGRQLDLLNGKGPRMVSPVGSIRRLRALVRLGWSTRQIAAAAGTSPKTIDHWTRGRGATMRRLSAEKIQRAYDRLSMRLPPERTTNEKQLAVRARSRGEHNSWAPPLAWDDDQIDDPLARPHYGSAWRSPFDIAMVMALVDGGVRTRKLHHDEAGEAVRLLRKRGISDRRIEDEYGLKPGRYREQAS